MGRARLNGIDVAFDDVGSGQDVLLLVHGHPFDRSMWREQIGHFSRAGWRVLAPDLRGYGETSVVPGQTQLEVFARDLVALMDHSGIARVVAVGLSMGGQIVMELARNHAARLHGVVLTATFPQAESAEGKRDRRAIAERLEAEGMAAYANELLPKMLAPRTIAERPDIADRVLEMMRHAPPAGAAAALRGRAERIDYTPYLALLSMPALIINGDQDAFTTHQAVKSMCDAIKGAELVWLEKVGHMPNLEAAPLFNAALMMFLDRVAKGATR